APPPTVNGTPLPYTAQGSGQVVLLNYTDATGWQIVDVLRNADGSPYPLVAGATSVAYTGAMSSSGETWITLRESLGSTRVAAVFHRRPGGAFELDAAATATLKPLIASGALSVRLGETSSGTVYGLLTTSAPPTTSQTVPSPDGPITVSARLDDGQLADGPWTVQGSPLPASYTAPSGGSFIGLEAADVTGPGTGWAALIQTGAGGNSLILARFDQNGWRFLPSTGLDVFDLTG